MNFIRRIEAPYQFFRKRGNRRAFSRFAIDTQHAHSKTTPQTCTSSALSANKWWRKRNLTVFCMAFCKLFGLVSSPTVVCPKRIGENLPNFTLDSLVSDSLELAVIRQVFTMENRLNKHQLNVQTILQNPTHTWAMVFHYSGFPLFNYLVFDRNLLFRRANDDDDDERIRKTTYSTADRLNIFTSAMRSDSSTVAMHEWFKLN